MHFFIKRLFIMVHTINHIDMLRLTDYESQQQYFFSLQKRECPLIYIVLLKLKYFSP